MKPVLLMAALASFFVATPSAQAGTITKQIEVTAEIAPFCAVNTFDLDFGTYTTANINGGVPLEAFSFVYVICPDETAYSIALDGGLNSPETGFACEPGAPAPDRLMKSTTPPGNGNLGYTLYSDEDRLVPWGCSPETDVDGIGDGIGFTEHRVYGRIPGGSITVADTYSDTVTVTVTF